MEMVAARSPASSARREEGRRCACGDLASMRSGLSGVTLDGVLMWK